MTERLIAYPATKDLIKQAADILNEEMEDNTINGKYYEDGKIKGEKWIERKNELILGDLDRGLSNWRFFYLREDPKYPVCFVGSELEFLENNQRGDKIMLAWGTSIGFQGKGLTSEAIKGFLTADIGRYSKR